MVSYTRDYGSKGRVGIAVPQANPTVEPEIGLLLPQQTTLLTSRLTSARAQPEDRWREYFDGLENTLATYDTLRLDVCGVAITAATYLVGRDAEDAKLKRISDLKGYPVISAGLAIEQALHTIGVKKLAIGAPYPEWSVNMSRDYWISRGFNVVSTTRIAIASDDTRSIYELSAQDALTTLENVDFSEADAILLTGTGMPSFAAVIALMECTGKPVVSSNICLAWAMRLAIDLPDDGIPGSAPHHPLLNGWQSRIGEL
jgi:maleate isomerase